jgi:hypothetical protein
MTPRHVVFFASGATVIAAALALAPPAVAQRTGEWVARMDGLAGALTSLLTNAASAGTDARDAGDEGQRRAQLRRDVEALRTLTHGLAAMKQTPDADPTIGFLLHELDEAIDDAGRADRGALPDAALAVAWTCMGCHTRASIGTPRPIASLAPVDASLPPDVRGIILAATRRFGEARRVFHEAARNEELAQAEPTRWERAVKGALLLDLRVNHDPRSALALVDDVLNTPGGDALWVEASAWRRALAPLAKSKRAWPRTFEELSAEAERLMSAADARGPTDAGREILYLNATAVIHELLMREPPKDMRPQALAWLGESYYALRDLDIWSLHLVYDAACVEAAPHSILAAECYERWLDGARASFTGNGGGELPPELAARGRALRVLAEKR